MKPVIRRTILTFTWGVSVGIFSLIFIKDPFRPLGGNFFIGWTLFACLILLATLIWMKHARLLRGLITPSLHLTFHIWLSTFIALLFLMHLDWHWPSGIFETALALLFFLILLSGFIGVWVKHHLAKRLTRKNEENLYDQMPLFRQKVNEEVNRLRLEALRETGDPSFDTLFQKKLAAFFQHNNNPLFTFFKYRKSMQKAEQAAQCFLPLTAFVKWRIPLINLMKEKMAVEYRYSIRCLLQSWQYWHGPLAIGLVLLIPLHILFVYGFGG